VITEPTAVALAYGLDCAENSVIVVYDLGGGTFNSDVSARPGWSFHRLPRQRSTCPSSHQARVIRSTSTRSYYVHSCPCLWSQSCRELRHRARMELSSTSQTEINLPFISSGPSNPQHININQKLLFAHAPLVQRTVESFKKAGVKASDINEVILVGGMMCMPRVVETRQWHG
ncbi:hypothetical protein F5888DRAFT_1624176, partial [Russula emetica]